MGAHTRQHHQCSNSWHRRQGRAALTLLLLASGACLGLAEEEPSEAQQAYDVAEKEYKRSGFRWITPYQFKNNVDLATNEKPIMVTFLSPRCWLCRGLLEHFALRENHVWLNSLSSQFHAVMVFNNYGYDLVHPDYTPESMYGVPATIFAWPNGTVRHDLYSRLYTEETPSNQWYYLPRELLFQMYSVLRSMYKDQEPYPSDLYDDLPS